jgi:hypothetical protein
VTDYTLSDSIPSPAVLTGLVSLAGVVTDTIVSPTVFTGSLPVGAVVSQTLLVPVTIAGALRTHAHISHVIAATTHVSGSFGSSATISDDIVSTVEVTGFFKITHGASSSKEAYYEQTGYRPSFPSLVYAREATLVAQVTAVPSNRSFLVASTFIPTPGDPFSDNGAGPNYIGTKNVDPLTNVAFLSFRAPVPNEVIWDVPESLLYRYETDSVSGVVSWKLYRSLPQRFLDGQVVFSILDPDGIYDYLGQVLGAAYAQWSYDLSVLLQQNDPRTCSHFFLSFLAEQFGLTLNFSDPIVVRRAKTASAVPAFKFKGTEQGVEIRLRDLGYVGYARELWANPGDPTCHIVNNSLGFAGNVPIVPTSSFTTTFGMDGGDDVTAAEGYISFRAQTPPTTSDTVTISDGTLTKVFQFDNPASGGNVAVTPGASPDDTMANLVTAINGSGLAVTATHITKQKTYGPPIRNQSVSSTAFGTRVSSVDPAEFREYPHGYWPVLIPVYVLTSRISIHVNKTDGTPLQFSTSPADVAAALALKQAIANDLQFDVLPAHIDIEFFATDRNVNGAGGEESVTVTEAFSVTHA